MIKNEICTVVSHEQIADSIFELTLKGELVSEMSQPGRFVHVKVTAGAEPLLRRPISVANINPSESQFTMIYRAEGRGTQLLAEKKPGDGVDILGPLGNGFPVEEAEAGDTALLVGGGIGIPPLYELAKQLTAKGIKIIAVLGFQSASAAFYEKEFAQLGETYVATVDGSLGTKGFITNVLTSRSILADVLYACGPIPMLKALETSHKGHKAFLSLEKRMGCGIGACFACVCHTAEDPEGHSYKKVCSDGPVFRAGEVIL